MASDEEKKAGAPKESKISEEGRRTKGKQDFRRCQSRVNARWGINSNAEQRRTNQTIRMRKRADGSCASIVLTIKRLAPAILNEVDLSVIIFLSFPSLTTARKS
ncbi:hypothetical protein T265_11512 [Opisthorchis viverrini]|uniref:Uncharacterized protein n=1 Tax=Opisthorchis viverrini TaxID=6198 RepID=A0A074YYC8_OPIVI|nr:hypothetical protein T265_11512 [Opisthorchis viverrini]KER19801.1 hypothetical protein T265_11512 [Opisthorchis viverrini]